MKVVLLATVLGIVSTAAYITGPQCQQIIDTANQQLGSLNCDLNYGCNYALPGSANACPRPPPPPPDACYIPNAQLDPNTCINSCVAAQSAYETAHNTNLGQACQQCGQVPHPCVCAACKKYAILNYATINNLYNGFSECQGAMGDPDITPCTCNYFSVLDSPRTNYQENCNNCYESVVDDPNATADVKKAARSRMQACACCHYNLQYGAQHPTQSGYGPTDTVLTDLSSRCQQWSWQAYSATQCMKNCAAGDSQCIIACQNNDGYRAFAIGTNSFSNGPAKYGPLYRDTSRQTFLANQQPQADDTCLYFFNH